MLGFGAIAAGSISDSPAAAGSNLTLALSGLAATTAQGALTPSPSVALSGHSASTAQGTLTVVITSGDVTLALAGLQVATGQGTVGVSHAQGLAGHSATASQGTIGVSSSKAIAGAAVTATAGTLGVGRQIAASGHSATAAQGAISIARTQALAGHGLTAAQGAVGYSLARGLAGDEVATLDGIITATTTNPDLNLPLNGHHVHADQGDIGVAISYGLPGAAVTAYHGSMAHERELATPGRESTVSAGSLYLSNEMSLDYVMHGYVDGGYVGATEATVVADMLGRLMAQATFANVYQINSIRVGGGGVSGNTWGPTTPPYVGSYTSVGGVPSMTTQLLAAVNATDLPVDVRKVNGVAVAGAGVPGNEWGPA